MAQRQDGLPATSLFLFATAVLLFGIGGGLVGYMVGQRHGEDRANAVIGALAVQWETSRGNARSQFDAAIENAAALLQKSAADLKAEVVMYHGCGAICNAIANQFGEELLRARDAVEKAEAPASPNWSEVLRQTGIPIQAGADGSTGMAPDGQLKGTFSRSTVIAMIALLCTTAVLCFGIACFSVLKLRAIGRGLE